MRSIVTILAVVALVSACAYAGMPAAEEIKAPAGEIKAAPALQLTDLPEPVRAAIEKLTAGGIIASIEKEKVDGKKVYSIEATVGGKKMEYDVAADGTVLSTEEGIAYDTLPAAVKAAAEKYFGSAEGLKASKEVENGKTIYEIEGLKDKKPVELELSETGSVLEVE